MNETARSNFALVAGDGVANTNATSTNYSATLGVSALGLSVNANAAIDMGVADTIPISHGTVFAGGVPPILNNPNTPEDEFGKNSFSFTPFVYRAHYSDPSGNDAGFYVLSYVVGQ